MAKKVCLYSVLTAMCLVLGYLESLVSLSFIAPGIKLGLANSVAIILIAKKDFKGAVCVNIARILLSAILFSSPYTLMFSLSAGIGSTVIMYLISLVPKISMISFSIIGGVTHNIIQTIVAFLIMGHGILYYIPVLIVSGAISGFIIGMLSQIICKKLKTNSKF